MKQLVSIILALIMLLALAACGTNNEPAEPTEAPKASEALNATGTPKASEAPAVTEAPAGTEAPSVQHEFKTGGVDFCEELVLGETYYYDLDGDALCDTVYYNNESPIAYFDYDFDTVMTYSRPNLKITSGRFPEAPYIYTITEETARIWVVDTDPDDGRLEIIETDEGPSDDPESEILIPDYHTSGFIMGWGYGVIIDEDHPFSSERGFNAVFWTHLMGTSILEGRCRIGWNEKEHRWTTVRADEEPYFYADYAGISGWEGFTLRQDITAEIVDEDLNVQETVTLPAGTKAIPCATDNETYLVLILSDGRLARVGIEEREFSEIPDDIRDNCMSDGGCYPWMIAGEWQDKLFEGIIYSG